MSADVVVDHLLHVHIGVLTIGAVGEGRPAVLATSQEVVGGHAVDLVELQRLAAYLCVQGTPHGGLVAVAIIVV